MADSCWCMTENHKILQTNYPSIKKNKVAKILKSGSLLRCRPVLLEGYCFCAACVQTLFWTRHSWLLCNALWDLESTKFLVAGYLVLVQTLSFIAVHIQPSLMDSFVQWVTSSGLTLAAWFIQGIKVCFMISASLGNPSYPRLKHWDSNKVYTTATSCDISLLLLGSR